MVGNGTGYSTSRPMIKEGLKKKNCPSCNNESRKKENLYQLIKMMRMYNFAFAECFQTEKYRKKQTNNIAILLSVPKLIFM